MAPPRFCHKPRQQIIPRHRRNKFDRRTFSFAGLTAWNCSDLSKRLAAGGTGVHEVLAKQGSQINSDANSLPMKPKYKSFTTKSVFLTGKIVQYLNFPWGILKSRDRFRPRGDAWNTHRLELFA